jgi:hypothetical protein
LPAHGPDGARNGTDAGDDVDPELLALPSPPRKERTLTLLLLALTAIASLAMAAALRADAAYAFRSSIPIDLGDLREASPASLTDDRFVSAHAMLGAAGAIRFERPFEGDTYRLSPVAGRGDVWVEVRVPAGTENGRYVPPSQFRGHLTRFRAGGLRNRGLAAAVESATGQSVPTPAWLLVDGETPNDATWAVGLVALFVGFALWNLAAIARIVRRVK